MKHFKIVFLGESKVGKTSIISQKYHITLRMNIPSMEDYFVKVHRLNCEDYHLEDKIQILILHSHQHLQGEFNLI